MCGIAGYIDWTGEKDTARLINQMNKVQNHRGPDSLNSFSQDNLSLGSVRLSILDLDDRASMPMESPDGNHVLIFNGEIYNFELLKSELQAKGHTFSTTSDTEVLLQILIAEGESCLTKLDGMFTFAYFNKSKNEILIARDRIGMKPLYYIAAEDSFIFSSEQKSIVSVNRNNLTLSEQGVSDIINIGYTYGTTNLFKEIKSLLPGHLLRVNTKTAESSTECFHNILHNYNERTWNKKLESRPGDIQAELEADILHAVEQHTVSDAGVGVICSGGVDSSLLAVFAHRFRKDIDLYHASIKGGIDELPYAEKVSDKIKRPLHTAVIDKESYMQNWARCIYHHDAPSYHPNDIPLYLVCQMARSRGKKVLVSGEGADELFGGYHVNLELKKRLFWNSFLEKLPSGLVSRWRGLFESFMQKGFPPEYQNTMNTMGITSTGRIKGFLYSQSLLYSKMERFQKSREINQVSSFLNSNERLVSGYLTERLFSHLITLLMRNDKMGMAASIETRIPFLSNTLIDKWVCMPSLFKINGTHHKNLKYILKNIAAKYLPTEILYRSKVGFSIPLSEYLNLNDKFFRGGYLQEYFKIQNDMLPSLYYDSNTFYKMASLEIWCQLFLLDNSIEDVQNNISQQLIHT